MAPIHDLCGAAIAFNLFCVGVRLSTLGKLGDFRTDQRLISSTSLALALAAGGYVCAGPGASRSLGYVASITALVVYFIVNEGADKHLEDFTHRFALGLTAAWYIVGFTNLQGPSSVFMHTIVLPAVLSILTLVTVEIKVAPQKKATWWMK